MNVHHTYALTSRTETNRFLRRWTSWSRTGFFSAVLLSDVAVIVGMAWLTSVGYHVAVYGSAGDILSYLEVGLLSAIVFVLPNLVRGEYKLTHFFSFKPHLRRSVHSWNVTLIRLLALGFLAQITVLSAPGWVLIYYSSTICLLLAVGYAFVRGTVFGSRVGLISAQRIFLFGTGRHIEEFITRHQPRSFGVSVVGCHFLTPVDPGASPQAQQQALDRDLEATVP